MDASWITAQLRKAEDFLENVDKTAKTLSEVPATSSGEQGERSSGSGGDGDGGSSGGRAGPEDTPTQQPPGSPQATQSTPQRLTVSRGRGGMNAARPKRLSPRALGRRGASASSSSKGGEGDSASAAEPSDHSDKSVALPDPSPSPRTARRQADVATAVADAVLQKSGEIFDVVSGLERIDPKADKETRLQKLCETLSTRLQESREENAALEALVDQYKMEARETDTGRRDLTDRIAQLEKDLETAKADSLQAKSVSEASQTKWEENRHILIKEKAVIEERVKTLEAELQAARIGSDEMGSAMVAELREGLMHAEESLRQEQEMAKVERESTSQRIQALEAAAVETATALAEKDRVLDATQTQLALKENEAAQLQAEAQSAASLVEDLENKLKVQMAKAHSDEQSGNGAGDESTQEGGRHSELDRLTQKVAELEQSRAELDAKLQVAQDESQTAKDEIMQQSGKEKAELETRLNELSELLYLKQTTIEKLNADKGIMRSRLESELSSTKAQLEDAKQSALQTKRALESSIEGPASFFQNTVTEDVEVGGEIRRSRVRVLGRGLRKTAQLLDYSAINFGRFLYHHPLPRLIFAAYLLCLHLFLLLLLNRLQAQAEMEETMDKADVMAQLNGQAPTIPTARSLSRG